MAGHYRPVDRDQAYLMPPSMAEWLPVEHPVWFVIEVILCSARLVLLLMAHRTAASGRRTPTDSYVLLAVLWGASVGYGAFVSILSGDWVAATL